jgi:ankyrin repeat protein
MNGRGSAELDGAVDANDLERVDDILRGVGDSPSSEFERSGSGKPLLASAHSVEMAAKLLEHGFEISDVSRWWASGLFVNPGVDPHVGRFLIDRGALLTPHAAAGLGLVEALEEMLDADSSRIHAQGGDGCTPLHFARSIEAAALLLDRGANVNARDDDHDSTPAQWLIAASPDVAAFLLEHGATPDIFLAASLGNRSLAERLIATDRSTPSHRIGKAPFHPIGYQGRGGTILQWTLGFNRYAHQIALQKGHQELFDFLIAESDVTTRFLVACVMADRPAAEAIIASSPGLVAKLPDADLELLARYCWETNMSVEAVRLMLDAGFPVEFPERSHGFTPLHNAAWGGYGELVELLVQRGHPVAVRDPNFNGTPLDWAVHCAVRDGRHPDGEYGRVARALIDAGCPWDRSSYPTGNDAIDKELRERIKGE